MEIEEEDNLDKDNFPSRYKKQDLTKERVFNKWLEKKKKEGKKIVKCPIFGDMNYLLNQLIIYVKIVEGNIVKNVLKNV